MKRFVTILVSTCFVMVSLLLSGSSLLAQESKAELESLRSQNEQLKRMVQQLQKELEKVKLQAQSQVATTISQPKQSAEELSAMEWLKEALTVRAGKGEHLIWDLPLLPTSYQGLQERVEQKFKAAVEAIEQAMKALEDADVTQKMEELLKQFPDSEKAREVREAYKRAMEKQAASRAKLAQAIKQYEEALRQTTPKQKLDLLGKDLLAQIARQGLISHKAKKLEDAILSEDDVGLLTQLRFEKVDLCRKLGKLDEAADQLSEIIEESPDESVKTTARWMLIELLQESGNTDEALHELKNMLEATTDAREKRSILYAIIQMAGDDPEAKLRATEEVIDWLEESVQKSKDAAEEAAEKARRARCLANLRELLKAMLMYADDHEGKFPNELSDLYPTYVSELSVFTCPSAPGPTITEEQIDLETRYVYRSGLAVTGVESPANEVLIYDNPANHDGEGGNVGFVDGHVQWLSAVELKKITDRDRRKEGVF